MPENILISWSGGKDSAMALYELAGDSQFCVSALLTTVTRDYDRVSIHGVRRELLEAQAASLGDPLELVAFPNAPPTKSMMLRWPKGSRHASKMGFLLSPTATFSWKT